MRISIFAAAILAAMLCGSSVYADGTCSAAPTNAPATWGASQVAESAPASPVARARDLLARAKLLDEAALSDERAAAELAARLPTLQATAKVARGRADRASGDDREALVSRAEDLEADLVVSTAESVAKRRSAIDNRRAAREMRARAIRLVRDTPTNYAPAATACDPPYHFTPDGRKIYRLECLK